MRFTLTEDHIKLLSNFYIEWDDNYNGAPCVDCKRPYGNRGVVADVCRILGWESIVDMHGEETFTLEQANEAQRLHEETQTALQIILCCKT